MGGVSFQGTGVALCVCIYVCKHGRGPWIKESLVLIWSWISDLCPLIHSWEMLFVLQTATEKKRAAQTAVVPLTPKMYSIKSSSVCLTHLETFSTVVPHLHTNTLHTWTCTITLNYPNLNVVDLKPHSQGASEGLLHNRNSIAGLIRQFFTTDRQTRKE